MPDPDIALERIVAQARFEVLQLALGAAAGEVPLLQGGYAGGIIAAVLQALERLDQRRRDRLAAQNSNNSAHGSSPFRKLPQSSAQSV